MTAADRDTAINLYDKLYARLTEQGQLPEVAALAVVEDYLDGKPRDKKARLTSADRNQAFWSSHVVHAIPLESWKSNTLTLALSRYFAQERTANTALLAELASSVPEAICTAGPVFGSRSATAFAATLGTRSVGCIVAGHCRIVPRPRYF